MSTVAPPVAGMSSLSAWRFLLVDGFGSLLYGARLLGLGLFFNLQMDQIISALARIGGSVLTLLGGLVVLFIAYKYWHRRQLLHDLRMAQITTSELRQMLGAGSGIMPNLIVEVAINELYADFRRTSRRLSRRFSCVGP